MVAREVLAVLLFHRSRGLLLVAATLLAASLWSGANAAESALTRRRVLQPRTVVAEAAQPTPSGAQPGGASEPQTSPGQAPATGAGVYGSMVSARGNLPANPAPYECVKVLDGGGTKLIAKGECTGPWASFKVPLPPGDYMVEAGGKYVTAKGKVRFLPNRYTVVVKPGQWIKISQPPPKQPVP
jgi:hypothetical protein